jgi:hypothetical protein
MKPLFDFTYVFEFVFEFNFSHPTLYININPKMIKAVADTRRNKRIFCILRNLRRDLDMTTFKVSVMATVPMIPPR